MAYTVPADDRDRQDRYEESFSARISTRTGEAYPCSQSLLDDLTDDTRPLQNNRYVPMEDAVLDLVDYLGPSFPGARSAPRAQALDRLRASATTRFWHADLVFKAFGDLDTLFFRRRLRGNVLLRWITPDGVAALAAEGYAPAMGWVRNYRPGPGERTVREKIGVFLNAEELLLGGTLMDVWKTLLHYMVHAYLVVMTGRFGDPGDLDGPSFGRCWRAVEHQFPWDLPSAGDVHPLRTYRRGGAG